MFVGKRYVFDLKPLLVGCRD